MNPTHPLPIMLLSCFAGGLLAAALLDWAQPEETAAPPSVHTVVFDCVNIQHAPPPAAFANDHPARYAIARLQRACEQQEAALALMQVWDADPTAGVVYEP